MSLTTDGVILVIICAFIEGLAHIFFKKSVLGSRRGFWVASGVALSVLHSVIYTAALVPSRFVLEFDLARSPAT